MLTFLSWLHKIPTPPCARRGSALLLAVAATALTALPASANDIIDLRDGVQTSLYGGRYSESPANGDFYGWAMAFGDVDGDGYEDFLGSSKNSEGPSDEHPGKESDVYLVFGGPRAEFDSVYAVDDPGGADIVFYMGGYSIACGDIDADGYDDLILAEITAQAGIHVVFGAPRDQLEPIYNFLRGRSDYTPPDLHIIGTRFLGGGRIDGGNLGFDYVSRALVTGDVNADGFADIIFGDIESGGPSGDRTRGGAVHIVFGRPRAEFPAVISVDSMAGLPLPDVSIYGEHADIYPFNLAVGDLDGDGTGDLVACVFWGDGQDNVRAGEINGFWGRRDWTPTYDTQIETFDFALTGGTGGIYNDRIGYRVAIADLDGDGRDDLIAGTPFASYPDRRNMGEYRIYFGRPRGLWPKWSDAYDMADVLILGAETGEAFHGNGPQEWGIAFSFATGRRNDDHFDDLLIGAGHGTRPDGSYTGKSYLLWGRPRGVWPAFIDLRDGYDVVFYGADSGGSPGYQFDLLGATNGMADWDGDGLDELFLSAQFGDGPDNFSQDCGEVYVFFSEDTLTTPVPPAPPVARAALLPNVPNPFNPVTTLRYQAPVGELVSLTVYDVRGREVARPLAPQPNLEPVGAVHWNAENLSSGVYFVKLRAGNESHAKKVHLVR